MVIERVESGIPGLDKLIEGGFVKNSINLLAGTTGTGKTIFGCQYLLKGLQKGENGVYITLEQSTEDILADIGRFGWDVMFKKYIDQKKLVLYSTYPTSIEKLGGSIFDLVKKINAKRLVLDSLSIATAGWEESADISKIRRNVFDMMTMLKRLGITSLLLTEIPEDKVKALSRFGFEEFLADSVIIVNYLEYAAGGTPRSLIVRKMRRTSHGTDIYPLVFTNEGLKVSAAKKGIVI
jgi:KaiC/GvpD/RAD55 family RecA-like ATPase